MKPTERENINDLIISNNYSVISTFDSVPDGTASNKHLSKDEATKAHSRKKRGYLTNYKVVENLAIVGIVPFNSEVAYVFNKELPKSESSDNMSIVSNTYESLMDCYVFGQERISEKYLNSLVLEYKNRGGVVFEKYHSFENLQLKKIREYRKTEFRNNIVFESIFKHGFREVRKNKWSNGLVTIKQKTTQRRSVRYPSHRSHLGMATSLENRILIGSIFGGFYSSINQLSDNMWGIPCSEKNNSRYNFAYFEVEF